MQPSEYHLYRFSAAQWQAVATQVESTKRVRRQRLANGQRKKKTTRRKVAIAKLPDDTSTPIEIALSSTLQDRWWAKQGLWSVVTANPNCWATAADNIANVSEDDFALIQETKIFKESMRKVAGTTARRLGWSHEIGTAHRTAGTMGAGGCAVLARNGTGISGLHNKAIPDAIAHRATIAWVSAIAKGGFYLLSIYLRDCVGMN